MKFFAVSYSCNSEAFDRCCVVCARNTHDAIRAIRSAEFGRDSYIIDIFEIKHFVNCEVVEK